MEKKARTKTTRSNDFYASKSVIVIGDDLVWVLPKERRNSEVGSR
jgi:hypothetical protein